MAKKSGKPKPRDLQRARERIYKQLLKRSALMAPDPKPARVTKVIVAPSKQGVARARQRHAQLVARRANADPGLV